MEASDLNQILIKADRHELLKRGLSIDGKLYRNLNLEKYGTIDLISFSAMYDNPATYIPGISNKTGELTIIEATTGKVNFFSLRKACMSLDKIVSYRKSIKDFGEMNFNILLIGTEVENLSETLSIWPPASGDLQRVTFVKFTYSISGLYFEEVASYQRTGEGFRKERKQSINLKPEGTVPGELIEMQIHKN